jgi:hypothetical protein
MFSRVKDYYEIDNLAVFIWIWGDTSLGYDVQGTYPPYPEVLQTSDALEEYGIKTLHRVLSFSFGSNDPLYEELNVEDYTIKKIDGEVLFAHPNLVYVDQSTDFWKDHMINFIVKQRLLNEAGGNGMFWDNPYPAGYSGYFPSNDRTSGPGGSWGYEEYAWLMENVRIEARKTNPEFVSAHEAAHEVYIRASDNSAPHGFLKQQIDGTEVIPMYETIYSGYIPFIISNHEYFFLYGYPDSGSYTDLKHMTFAAIEAYRWGHSVNTQETLSWTFGEQVANHEAELFSGAAGLGSEVQDIKEYAAYLKKLIKLRKDTRKFLTYGELLRVLETDSPNVGIPFRNIQTGEIFDVPTQKVVNSVWGANDGSIGIFFANYNREEQIVSYELDYSDLGLDSGIDYDVYIIDDNGRNYSKTISSDSSETTTFAPLSALLVELTESTGGVCGDGFKTHDEVCDTLGDIGCVAGESCSSCVSCNVSGSDDDGSDGGGNNGGGGGDDSDDDGNDGGDDDNGNSGSDDGGDVGGNGGNSDEGDGWLRSAARALGESGLGAWIAGVLFVIGIVVIVILIILRRRRSRFEIF